MATKQSAAGSESEHSKCQPQRPQGRRAYERYPLHGVSGSLIYKGVFYPCQFIDIGIGGCCVHTERPFTDGALAEVRLILQIHGISLRIGGITQWTSEDSRLGIRFNHPSPSSRNQLAGLLICLIDNNAAGTIQEAIASSPSDLFSQFSLTAEHSNPSEAPLTVTAGIESLASFPEPLAPQSAEPAPAAETELPASIDQDWPAVLTVLKDNSRLAGVIRGLFSEGCEFHSPHPYKGRLDLRVEVWFHMRKLPFQLSGVTDFLIDDHTIGIRFLQLSPRKRKELEQVIEEIHEQEREQRQEQAAG